MAELRTMTTTELDRVRVIQMVLSGKLTWKEAATQLDLSERQIGNLCARVRREGPRGLGHRLRGRPSNRRLAAGLVARAVALVAKRYPDFGPTFAAEQLQRRHGLRLSVATLRRALLHAGLWRPRRQKPRHRAWRERRPWVGMLIQVDGSAHAWFEDRGPRCVLLLYIDDATSRLLYGEFVEHEDTLTLLRTSKTYLERYGRPVAFYVDKDSIYRINRQPTLEEQLQDAQPLTQFTRAMGELDIAVITAHSPQAKGRVERSFRTHQDRLVKELRLQGIRTIPAANAFLWTSYLPAHNARCAQAPANPTDAHRPLQRTHVLADILTVRTERTVRADWTVRFRNQWWQLGRAQPVGVRPRDKVNVEIRVDGTVHLRRHGQELIATLLPQSSPSSGCERRKGGARADSQKSDAHNGLRINDRPVGQALGRPVSRVTRLITPATPARTHPWRKRILAPTPPPNTTASPAP